MLCLVLCFCMALQVLGQDLSNSEDSAPDTMLGTPALPTNIGDNIRNALRVMMSQTTTTTSSPETVSRNRFINAFVILPTTTQTTTTVKTDKQSDVLTGLSSTSSQARPVFSRSRLGGGSFIILPTTKTTASSIVNPNARTVSRKSTVAQSVENTTEVTTAVETTTIEDSETTPEPREETTWDEYYTVLITTEGEVDDIDIQTEAVKTASSEDTTPQSTSKSSTRTKENLLASPATLATTKSSSSFSTRSTRRTRPTSSTKAFSPPRITTRTFPMYRPMTTSTRKLYTTTPKKVPGKAMVFKNTGIKFIPLVPVAPSNTPRSYSTRKTPGSTRKTSLVPTKMTTTTSRDRILSRSTTESKKPVLVEVTEAYLPGGNGMGNRKGVGFGGGIQNGNLNPPQVESTTSGDAGAILIAGADVPIYVNSAKFWAKYWYWILIGILLIIFLIIIPGCCCQIYFYRRCRRARRKDSKQKKTSEMDLEEGNIASRMESTDWNSDTDEGSHAAVDRITIHNSSSPVSSLPHCLPSSLPEADIPRGQPDDDGRLVTPNQENRKVIEFSSDNLPRIIDLSASVSGSAINDYGFGYSPENHRSPNPDDYSEIKLDFSNEEIIKSNAINEPVPVRDPLVPVPPRREANPPRPPKPEHLVPPVPKIDFVPERRVKTDRKKRRSGENKAKQTGAPAGRYRSPDRKKDSTRKSGNGKKRDSSKKKIESPTRKDIKKQNSNQQSLIEAAQSLENILEAITRLTKEYPIPKLPTQGENLKTKDTSRKNRKRVEKRTKERSRRERRTPKNDEDMFANKMKRTRRWADEQKRLDDYEEREKEKERSRRRERDTKREKRSTREETSRKKRREKSEKRRKRNSGDEVPREEENKASEKDKPQKIPTLMKIKPLEVDKTKEERQRMKLERDLAKLKRYHNHAAKKAEKKTAEDDENATEMKEVTPPVPLLPVVEAFDTTTT